MESPLAVFKRDPATGTLSQTSCIQERAAPDSGNGETAAVECSEVDNIDASDVTVSPDGKFVYVAETAYSMIAVFARDSASGAVSGDECIQEPNADNDVAPIRVCQHAIGIADPGSLALSPDGSTLYSAGNGVVAVFATTPATSSRNAAVRRGVAGVRVSCPAPGGGPAAARSRWRVPTRRAGSHWRPGRHAASASASRRACRRRCGSVGACVARLSSEPPTAARGRSCTRSSCGWRGRRADHQSKPPAKEQAP